jgi:hemoglobin
MKNDIATRNDVVKLVDLFYEKVKQDDLLSPVFAHLNWPDHLPIMYNFWSSILLGDRSYLGNPFQKHQGLAITPPHFERWLHLFNETVNTHFEGPIATEARSRANSIASLFQYKMGLIGSTH